MAKRFKLVPEMEGTTARWYAKQRGTESQLARVRKQAADFIGGMPKGAKLLEIAPGPGYLAVEMARTGRVRVTALDVSHTFVEIATAYAREQGVEVELVQGDVACMPFADASFDRIVSQAAFKNFADPVRALDEMHRVLRPGGVAVIQDLSKEASSEDIDREVRDMHLSAWSTFTTKLVLGTMLRRRAYTPAQFEALAAESAFRVCDVRKDGIGVEVSFKKPAQSVNVASSAPS